MTTCQTLSLSECYIGRQQYINMHLKIYCFIENIFHLVVKSFILIKRVQAGDLLSKVLHFISLQEAFRATFTDSHAIQVATSAFRGESRRLKLLVTKGVLIGLLITTTV